MHLDPIEQRRLTDVAPRLRRMDPELVEWTVWDVREYGLRLAAELTLTDADQPLAQLADILREIAQELDAKCGEERRTSEERRTNEPCTSDCRHRKPIAGDSCRVKQRREMPPTGLPFDVDQSAIPSTPGMKQ